MICLEHVAVDDDLFFGDTKVTRWLVENLRQIHQGVFNRLFGLFLGVRFYLQSRSKEQLATHKADAISQRATIGKQISEVSASLEDIWMGMGCGGFGRYPWMTRICRWFDHV